MLVMHVSGVNRCDCELHDWVELTDASGEWVTRLTIDSEMGAAIVGALAEPPQPDPAVEELLRSGFAGPAASLRNLSLCCQDHHLTAHLHFDSDEGPSAAEINSCRGLLAASRLRLPIMVDRADAGFFHRTEVPAPFAAAFELR